ncbi:Nitrate transporter 1.1 [Platanthera zijinensis]|uniref:Nitrate transporter 1.1 n=1 Tax=Platanthera zijinensis TaxID=2320716 RepID=A0AAP0GGD9_9ASPA
MDGSPDQVQSDEIISDAWDFNGRPALRSRTGGWTSAAMILVVELCERLTTLGIGVNLVTYLKNTMHFGNAASANTVTNYLGTSFMLSLLGGFVADTYIGRYLTIAIFAAVQASGVVILTVSTVAPGLRPPPCGDPVATRCAQATGTQTGVMYLALYLTALGTGGIKSSVSGLGSDQFDESNRVERQQMTRFFNWFFFFISIGSLIAVTVLVYIQDNVGRWLGYGICAAAILVGLTVFLAGSPRYRFKKLVGSPLTQIAAVLTAAVRKRGLPLPSDTSLLHEIDAFTSNDEAAGKTRKSKFKQRLALSDQFRFLNRAAIIEPSPWPAATKQSRWKLSTATDVEEVKLILRMLPIWATTIIFWTVYAQMTTFSVSQASTMNRHIGSSFQISSGSLTAFFVISILITVPVYDRLMVPLFRLLTGNPQFFTPLRQIGVGLVLSVLAMASAALIELKRLRASADSPSTQLSVFWLLPQFILVGSGVAFAYMGQLDFFLRECPAGMKTMSTGLFLSTVSLGFFFSTTLVTIVHKVTGESGHGAWLPDDINKGRLYNFYWLLVGLGGINLILFWASAKWYVYRVKTMTETGENEELVIHA